MPAKLKRTRFVLSALAVAILVGIGVRLWFLDGLFRRITVEGPSMAPALEPAERVVIDRWPLLFRAPRHGEVVAFHVPDSDSEFAVKRVAFLPGERPTIRAGELYDGDRKLPVLTPEPREKYLDPYGLERDWQAEQPLAADEFFLLGDNQPVSTDSRHFGPISRSKIVGVVRKR